MKRGVAASLIVLGLVAGVMVGSVARASAGGSEVSILCLNKDGSRYVRKVSPRDCAIFGPGQIDAGGVNLKKLHWRDWGQRRARARGIECSFHLPCQHIRARVRVSHRRIRCGHRVYTRVVARTKYGEAHPDPPGCPGPIY